MTERFFRNYKYVLIAALIVMLIPVVVASFHTRPTLDDLNQPYPVMQTWKDTGSVVQTVAAAFEAAYTIWTNRSGIFFSMLLSCLPMTVFGDGLLWISILLILAFFLSALLRTSKLISTLYPNVSRDAAHCAALLFGIMMLLFMPDYRSAFFWFSAAINYTFVFALALHLFISVICNCIKEKTGLWRVIGLSAGFFCVGGANWMTPTASIVIYAAIAIWIFLKRKPKRWIIPFTFLLAGYLLAVIAPGNAARQETMNVDVPLVQAGITAVLKGLAYVVGNGTLGSYALFMLLLVPVCCELAKHISAESRYPFWLPLLSLCVLAANRFPLDYQSAYWGERHTDACFTMLCLVLAVNAVVMMTWAFKRSGGRPLVRTGRGMVALGAAVVITIGAVSFSNMNWYEKRFNCTLQPLSLVMKVADGSTARYAQQYDEMTQYLRAHAGEDIVLETLPYCEFVGCPYELITKWPGEWQNVGMAQWYCGDGTVVAGKK